MGNHTVLKQTNGKTTYYKKSPFHLIIISLEKRKFITISTKISPNNKYGELYRVRRIYLRHKTFSL